MPIGQIGDDQMRPPEAREQLAGLSGIAERQHAAAHIVPGRSGKASRRAPSFAQALLLGGERGCGSPRQYWVMKARRALDVGAVDVETGDIGAQRQGREQRGPAAAQRIDDVERRPVAAVKVRRVLRHVAKEVGEGFVGLALVAPGRRHVGRG